MNVYTGKSKNEADSLNPRKFNIIKSSTIATEIPTWCPYRAGIAEVIASAPAETETATVNI